MDIKKLKIISWNVNGIRAVAKKGFLDWINKENPDILCIQETKAHEDQVPFDIKFISGFDSVFSNPIRKGYSGVATYSKLKALSNLTSIENNDFDEEGRVIISNYGDFVLLNVYFPNGARNEERLSFKLGFYEHLLEYLKELLKTQKNIIICGDVNTAHKEIDLFHPKENSNQSGFLPQERAWIDKLLEVGFIDSFREFNKEPHQYSWWDVKSRARERNVGWRIDYFFVSNNLKKNLKNGFILPQVTGSDHCPVGIELEF